MKDDLTKRVFWKLGIVKELLKGRDSKYELHSSRFLTLISF